MTNASSICNFVFLRGIQQLSKRNNAVTSLTIATPANICTHLYQQALIILKISSLLKFGQRPRACSSRMYLHHIFWLFFIEILVHYFCDFAQYCKKYAVYFIVYKIHLSEALCK